MASDKKSQLAQVERLQELWLDEMVKRIESGTATSQDLATLARFLGNNGWSLDPSKLPESLQSKLTSPISAEELDDAVIPIRKVQY